MLWVVSICAYKGRVSERRIVHLPLMIVAESGEDANEKGHRVAHKLMPADQGWSGHHVVSNNAEVVTDPDADMRLADTEEETAA